MGAGDWICLSDCWNEWIFPSYIAITI